MTFQELVYKAATLFPGVLLERVVSHRMRQIIKKVTTILILILFVLFILSTFLGELTGLGNYIFNIRGAFFLAFVIWLIFYLLDAMYFSFYFEKKAPMDFEVAQLVLNTKSDDITGSFLKSPIGEVIMIRLGIPISETIDFLKKRQNFVTSSEYYVIENDDDPYITIAEYARSIVHFDPEFADFLKVHRVNANSFKGAINWVARNQRKIKEVEAWWHKERLQRLPSIGRNWAYGQVYHLTRFGHHISEDTAYQKLNKHSRLYEDEVESMERIFLKGVGANVMLIADESAQAVNVAAAFGKEIAKRAVHHDLEGQRMYVLDGARIIEAMQEKISFENELHEIFAQAANAGNAILVISDLPNFAASAHTIGADVLNLLKTALASEALHVIAVAHTKGFHQTIETNHDLMRHFEKIILPPLDPENTLMMIESEALAVEHKDKVIFTYQALEAAVESALRYFAESSLAEKAVDILHEAGPLVKADDRKLVLDADIKKLVEKRTGVPQGQISSDEKEKLKDLEAILHKRIVGQDKAITAIASAMRRSRAGLTNPKRPMGSFLFLGPTGVGKTETTKALAATFFSDEEKIIRIDMSEYSAADGLEKLIGSFESTVTGTLPAKLRETQYGVLLLDEFEKASQQVHDIFLQILDEGFFTDGRGEKINARNLIIIATSNAGSDLIYEVTKNLSGDSVDTVDTENIVDTIVEKNIFRPELLNRFDGVIVFHALSTTHLHKVANLMLAAFNRRLSPKGISVEATEPLIQYLVTVGSDPTFGARAMNRAIQNKVENVIAEGLIGGDIKEGDTITLVPPDYPGGPLTIST